MNKANLTLAKEVIDAATEKGLKIATSESCTGGRIAAALTSVAGSSKCFEAGFVTYSYDAKSTILGMNPKILQSQGAVNDATVLSMSEGAFIHTKADITIATSGIAGPDGGSKNKPVGLVYFGWGYRDKALPTGLAEDLGHTIAKEMVPRKHPVDPIVNAHGFRLDSGHIIFRNDGRESIQQSATFVALQCLKLLVRALFV